MPSHPITTPLPAIVTDHFPTPCSSSPTTTCHFPNQPRFLQILPLNTPRLCSVPGCPFLPPPAKSALTPEAERVPSFSGSHGTLYLVVGSPKQFEIVHVYFWCFLEAGSAFVSGIMGAPGLTQCFMARRRCLKNTHEWMIHLDPDMECTRSGFESLPATTGKW